MQEKDNVLSILEGTKEAITKQDSIRLKDLSNQTIHTASTSQDPDNIAVAVIIYSLSKIIERKEYQMEKDWGKFYKIIILSLDNAIKNINNDKKLRADLENIRGAISKVSGKLKDYIQDVFRKASINKASRIYEHGVSMETTAQLLGISLFELAGYVGQTGVSDVPESRTLTTRARIKLAMEMFE